MVLLIAQIGWLLMTSAGSQAQAAGPVATGKALFAERCSLCHGVDGTGGTLAASILPRIAALDEAGLRNAIANGVPARGMPPCALPPQEMTAVVAYLRGLRATPARGGDDLEFDGWSVRVIPSLHGILRRAPFLRRDPNAPAAPAIIPTDAVAPLRLDQYAEGGTLAYLIRIGGRQILVFGSMNYIEREVEGLRPDVALIGAMPERREIHDYTGRLLKAIGYPRMVLPTHWDRFNVTYDVSQAPAIDRLQSFIAEVKAASPASVVIVPKYFEAIDVR